VFEEVWFEHEAESVRSVTPRIHWPALRIRLESLPRLRM
jgi:hypothetical protein